MRSAASVEDEPVSSRAGTSSSASIALRDSGTSRTEPDVFPYAFVRPSTCVRTYDAGDGPCAVDVLPLERRPLLGRIPVAAANRIIGP